LLAVKDEERLKMDSSREPQRGVIETAIQMLIQNSDHLSFADYWQILWKGIPAKLIWIILGVAFSLLVAVAGGSWNLSRKFLPPPTAPEPIWLAGNVQTDEGQPLTDFQIGVVEKKSLFLDRKDGSFLIQVPPKDTYSIIVWPSEGFYPSRYLEPLVTKTGDRNSIGTLGGFPTNLGIVAGSATYSDSRPVKGYVEVEGIIRPIEPNGDFTVTKIPLGKTKIRVIADQNGPVLHEDDVHIQILGLTRQDIIIPK
jgi:hypothetical protein